MDIDEVPHDTRPLACDVLPSATRRWLRMRRRETVPPPVALSAVAFPPAEDDARSAYSATELTRWLDDDARVDAPVGRAPDEAADPPPVIRLVPVPDTSRAELEARIAAVTAERDALRAQLEALLAYYETRLERGLTLPRPRVEAASDRQAS